MKTIDYLDAMRAKLRLTSDYQLAKRLAVSHQRISNYRTMRSTFDATIAARVAEILEIEPIKVIADTEIERATKPEHRKLWETIAAKVAAGVLVAIGAGISVPDVRAGFNTSPNSATQAGGIHIDRLKRTAG
jgi:transcriptional regulator with XRE-family HTH domain